MNDGTFGVTGDLQEIDSDIVSSVEDHHFEPVRAVFWRNSTLDFSSLKGLRRSLDARPPAPEFMRAKNSDDVLVLDYMMQNSELSALATSPEAVRLLWEVCKTPDYRKDLSDSHPRLLSNVYRYLMSDTGVIPTDNVARSLAHLDRCDGDIDTLVARIAHVRTWTYISHRSDWLDRADYWQGKARALENKLSDALHERLTQRFVDRRATILIRRLRERGGALVAGVTAAGDVVVEGENVGLVHGFRFKADGNIGETDMHAANRALRGEMGARVTAMETDSDDAFQLEAIRRICWRTAPVARLFAGPELLKPGIDVLPSEFLDPGERERLRRRLVRWLEGHLRRVLAPLYRVTNASLAGAARGLAYQIAECGGSVTRASAAVQMDALGTRDRRILTRLGVRFGVETIFVPALLKATAVQLRTQLAAVHMDVHPAAPPDGSRVSVPIEDGVPVEYYAAAGYRVADSLAVRVDVLERLLAGLRSWARGGPFVAPPEMITMIGARTQDFPALLRTFGYAAEASEAGIQVYPSRQARTVPRRRVKMEHPLTTSFTREDKVQPQAKDSPFAKLSELMLPQRTGTGGRSRHRRSRR